MGVLDWLDSFFSGAASTIGSAVASAVHWALRGITALILGEFRAVTRAWGAYYTAVRWYLSAYAKFMMAAYQQIRYTILVRIPHLAAWAGRELGRLGSLISGLARQVYRDVAGLIARIGAAARAVTAWVTAQVWAPLRALALSIYHDLLKWGYTAWWWITHLPKLADVLILHLAVSAEKYAWTLARMLGRFTMALIVHNVRRIALLLEDIVTAVL